MCIGAVLIKIKILTNEKGARSMAREDDIKNILDDRNIKVLLHFTQLDNLPSILKNGLRVKDDLDTLAKCNDELRLDNHTDTISMSVQHPNDPMFYKYRHEKPDAGWCILGVPASILLKQDALFCKRNAASAYIRTQSEEDLRNPASLEGMFEEIQGYTPRKDHYLKRNDPTDVQAEILVKGTISPKNITGIVFMSPQAFNDHKNIIGNRTIRIHGERVTYLSRRDIKRKHENG